MANGDKKTSQLDLFTTLATGAYIPVVNNGNLVRATIDTVLNDTNNRFWLNTYGAPAYDAYGNSFGRFRVVSGNLWVSGTNAYLESSNLRVNGSGYIFQLIGGATSNSVVGTISSIGGGTSNKTYSNYAFIGNGTANVISGDYSVTLGGNSNVSYGQYAVIAGGQSNVSRSTHNSIGGGTTNNIYSNSNYGTIAGGSTNSVSGTASSILGGQSNSVTSTNSVIVGGNTNTITANNTSAIVGGELNINSGAYSFIGAGYGNRCVGPYSVIPGGFSNRINGTSINSSVIGGGYTNIINSCEYSVIAGGSSNTMHWDGSTTNTYNFIAGGESNIASGSYNTVLGGKSNYSNKNYNLTWGRQSYAIHNGATVFSDQRSSNKYSQGIDTFNLFYTGGAYLSGTPLYVLGAEAYVSGKFAIGMSNVPTSASSAGRAGEITFNGTSGFFCTATNTWKAFPLFGFTDPMPATGAVSNNYGFVFGAGTNYTYPVGPSTDANFTTITFAAGQSPTITIPAPTAGTANYVVDALIRYKGSDPDTYAFRLYDTTDSAVLGNTSISSYELGNLSVIRERAIKVPVSVSSAKTIVLQSYAVDSGGNNASYILASGTQMSYMRMT